MAAGALLLIVTFTPLVPWTAARLSSKWTGGDRGVLIVLAGSTIDFPGFPGDKAIGESTYWRAIYAVDAWRTGHFQKVLLSGAGMSETVKPFLLAYGVPESAILVENRSKSTRESAAFAKSILAGSPVPLVLLTSDFHMFRASRCFAHEGMPVGTRPIPDVLKRSYNLVLRWQCFWTVAGELEKVAYYKLRGWI